ncbi:MAG: segregation/condensation protein A [Desulfosarcinaceae bacterium]|nr:segregation/condensation protein A [Desulfosarcinaceae bacterium]
MSSEAYRVQLSDIFEGPMDLLVYLIKKNEVDIHDIPIARITQQYLAYVEWIRLMNLDSVGDFLLMASTLAQIKSRTLLPVHGNEDEELEDPRLEIARPLLEYLEIKSVADQLAERPLLGEATFARPAEKGQFAGGQEEELIKIGLFELIDAFQKVLKASGGLHKVDLQTDKFSVKEKISELTDLLEEKGSLSFAELFSPNPSRAEVIVTFLAILEMVKLTLLRVAQHAQSGIIRLFFVDA